MTILSGVVGHSAVAFLSERYTAFFAGILFLVFGYKLTMEGLEMSKDAGVEEEMAEVEEEIAIKDMNQDMDDVEKGGDTAYDKQLKNASIGKKNSAQDSRISIIYVFPSLGSNFPDGFPRRAR